MKKMFVLPILLLSGLNTTTFAASKAPSKDEATSPAVIAVIQTDTATDEAKDSTTAQATITIRPKAERPKSARKGEMVGPFASITAPNSPSSISSSSSTGAMTGTGSPSVRSTLNSGFSAITLSPSPSISTTASNSSQRRSASTALEGRQTPIGRRTPIERRTPTILVVDDQEIQQKFLRNALESKKATTPKYTVVVASKGKEALDNIMRSPVSPFDAIIMDRDMPVMDGFTATAEIIKLHPVSALPIIGHSATTAPEEWAKAGTPHNITKGNMTALKTKLTEVIDIAAQNNDHLEKMAALLNNNGIEAKDTQKDILTAVNLLLDAELDASNIYTLLGQMLEDKATPDEIIEELLTNLGPSATQQDTATLESKDSKKDAGNAKS